MKRLGLLLGLTLGLCALGIGVPMTSRAAGTNGENTPWDLLKNTLFGDRAIQEGPDGIIQLDVPLRPDNGAAVPISIKSAAPQSPERYVKNVFLIVDNNPEPMVASFHLTPESGLADLATNIRIMMFSHVRAIAEMNTGELFMSSKFVKASGGCTPPPRVAEAVASAGMGKMELRAQNDSLLNQPNWLQLIITHPNHTGFQYDPVKGYPIPPHFINRLAVTYGDATILTAETGIAISEDPSFRFYFIPRERGTIKAEAKDSKNFAFTTSVDVTPK